MSYELEFLRFVCCKNYLNFNRAILFPNILAGFYSLCFFRRGTKRFFCSCQGSLSDESLQPLSMSLEERDELALWK